MGRGLGESEGVGQGVIKMNIPSRGAWGLGSGVGGETGVGPLSGINSPLSGIPSPLSGIPSPIWYAIPISDIPSPLSGIPSTLSGIASH